ncbi:MAG: trypsin-like peptidase domain-containing protein [Ornithinibacter sp.]
MTSDQDDSVREPWHPWSRPDPAPVPSGAPEPTQEIPQRAALSEEPAQPAWFAAPRWSDTPPPAATPPGQGQYAAVSAGAQPRIPASPPRRGPGWGALVGVSCAAALLAGVTGGVIGSSLADGQSPARTGSVSAPAAGAGAVTRPEGSIANTAANVTPSVVTLRVMGSDGGATGSGWVYDDQGHLVTNNHVVAGAVKGKVTVVLANGKQLEGTVVGRDGSYDLAVVKVEGANLTPLPLGRSADVVVGDQVIAVGAPLGLDSTVTTGIVSALNRPVTPGEADDQSYINAIQTDAAINPGNSGGPLLDMQGRVIGVNSAIARVSGSTVSGQSGNIGVGFAIPSDQVAKTVEQLIKTGKAEHPVIGVFLDSTYDGEGVRIADQGPNGQAAVDPDGPAAAAGLKAGDVIVAFEGRPVTDDGELVVAIRARGVGDSVVLTVRRGGGDRDVTMVLKGSGS